MQDGQDVLAALLHASARTWRLSDGRGALSRGTASGAATRRSHALLAAPLVGPRADLPAISLLRFDDRVTPPGAPPIELTPAFARSQRRDAPPALIVRAGALPLLEAFADQPWPRWRFRGEGWVLEREYRLVAGHAALLASWRLIEGGPLRLHVAPLMVARTLQGLQQETPEFRGAVSGVPGRVRCVSVEGFAPLTLWHNGAFMPARAWHRDLAYPHDLGGDLRDPDIGTHLASEDAFLPGWMQFALTEPGSTLHVVASPEEALFRALAGEQRLGTPPARTLADCLHALDLSLGDQRASWQTAALFGASSTARQAAAAHAARRAAELAAAEGKKPGPPPEAEPADIANTPFVLSLGSRMLDAIHERADRTSVLTDPAQHAEHGPDALRVAAGLVTLRAFAPARDIARGYLSYIDEGLAPERFDEQGFPHYESPESSLWLVHVVDLLARRDAESEATQAFLRDQAYRVLEGVLQHLRSGSRHGVHCDREGFLWAGEGEAAGCRADLNALWYHALVAMSQLAKQAGRRESAAFSMAWARELQRAYLERFWDEASGALYAQVTAAGPVRGLSPAQLHAVSLPPMLLPYEHSVRLVSTITRELWTPRGLRPRPGDGTPEPAWLGTWASATLRAHQRDAATEGRVRLALANYAAIGEGAAAELSARGAADLLRAWIEEIDHTAVPAS